MSLKTHLEHDVSPNNFHWLFIICLAHGTAEWLNESRILPLMWRHAGTKPGAWERLKNAWRISQHVNGERNLLSLLQTAPATSLFSLSVWPEPRAAEGECSDGCSAGTVSGGKQGGLAVEDCVPSRARDSFSTAVDGLQTYQREQTSCSLSEQTEAVGAFSLGCFFLYLQIFVSKFIEHKKSNFFFWLSASDLRSTWVVVEH